MEQSNFSKVDRTVGYPVRDIMTPESELKCWDGQEKTRKRLIKASKDITYIPIKTLGKIDKIIRFEQLKNGGQAETISLEWVISANTPILELLDLFAKSPDKIFLVLDKDKITGIVAPADLNKIPARASLYLLLAHFEKELAEWIRSELKLNDEGYKAYLKKKNIVSRLEGIQKKAQESDKHLDFSYYLGIAEWKEIIAQEEKLYSALKLHKDDVERFFNVKAVRNPVAHLSNELITSRSQLQEINEICDNLLKIHEKIKSARAKR